MPRAASARAIVLATAVLFSTGGVAIKATSLGAVEVAGFRAALAAVTLLVLLRPPRTSYGAAALAVGACQAATMLLFVIANKHTTAAAAIFLQGSAPVWVALLSLVLLREPVRRRDVAALAAWALGLVLLVRGSTAVFASAPDPAAGNAVALASGVTWAFTITGLRWLATRGGAAAAAPVLGNAALGLAALPWLVRARPSLADTLVLGWLGIFQVGLAYALLATGVRRVRALEASILLLAEPVLSTLWAWLAFGERPGPLGLAGCAILLAAAVHGGRGSAERAA